MLGAEQLSSFQRFQTMVSDHKLMTTGVVLVALAGIATLAFLFIPAANGWFNHSFAPWSLKELSNIKESWDVCALGAAGVALPYLFYKNLQEPKKVEEEKVFIGLPAEEPLVMAESSKSANKNALATERWNPVPVLKETPKTESTSKTTIAVAVALFLLMGLVGYNIYSHAPQIVEHWDVLVAGSTTSLTLIGLYQYIKWANQPSADE